MPERDVLRRDNLPNIRGEEEVELRYLISMIENLSWQLSSNPAKHPTCLLGRHTKSPSAASSFIAAVYSMTKPGTKTLELGPEFGATRREALGRLLEVVEGELGRTIVRDARRKDAGGAGASAVNGGGGGGSNGREEGTMSGTSLAPSAGWDGGGERGLCWLVGGERGKMRLWKEGME
ncbi:hypothetical protein N0V90_001339 [Kalmusia sp. IMI 367209]|nr:hypothetical protein N0V90_001339 [Kalmusia sp. IMI 367209]